MSDILQALLQVGDKLTNFIQQVSDQKIKIIMQGQKLSLHDHSIGVNLQSV